MRVDGGSALAGLTDSTLLFFQSCAFIMNAGAVSGGERPD